MHCRRYARDVVAATLPYGELMDLLSKYAAAATLTITLASLASGAYRQSAVVDNESNLYVDGLLGGKIRLGTSPTVGNIKIWLYGSWDGSTYTAGCTGADAAFIPAGEDAQLLLVSTIVTNTTTGHDYEFGPIDVAQAFGFIMPRKWGLVVQNNTGVALDATAGNHVIKFTGVNQQIPGEPSIIGFGYTALERRIRGLNRGLAA